jgi:hypothetical protein
MECEICYMKEATYKIQCDSIVPHRMCPTCEQEWRLKAEPTRSGRIMTCPFCRKEERGTRTSLSYEMELKKVYEELHQERHRLASHRLPSHTSNYFATLVH